MTTITSRDITEQIKQLNFNPSEIHRVILHGIRENTEGAVTIFNPTGPMMQCIEPGILTPVAVLQEIRSITRRLYAPAADDWPSLYTHMTDEDLNDLTNQPSGCSITFFMAVDEIIQKAVELNGNPDVRIIEIPKHTKITVGDYSLMLKFPFVIQVNRFGDISVKYDLSGEATLGRVRNALINHKFVRYNDINSISFPIEVVQVALSSQVLPISPSSGLTKRIKLTDNLFRIKAYTRFNRGQWIEIDTTRRMRVLNRNKATLQYIENNGELTIQIPSFYLVNGMLGTEVRVDIYTTKGLLEHPLVNYNESAYKLKYDDYNNPSNQYAGILGSFSILKIYSADVLTGGRNGLGFNEMKDRVINRSTISEGLPITELELTNKLSDLGMSSTKVIDNVTDRIYAASRLVPPPSTNLTVTGIGCNVQTHQTTITELAALDTARDNGARVTVLPSTLYNMVNGVLKVVDSSLVRTMIDPDLTSPETLSTWANQNELVFSPYFYVHDTANNEYEVRPYRLDSPDVLGKVTINENPTLQLSAGVFNYQIVANSDLSGYTLYLGLAIGGTSFKEIPLSDISLQISYTDSSGENRYYINGSLHTPIDINTGRPLNDQYIYRFDFNTDWDINKDHQLIMSDSFLPVPLECEMDIFIIIKGYRPTGFAGTSMDSIINLFSLDNYDGQTPQAALIQERLSVKFGSYMSNIWKRARSTISSADFKRYDVNIPALYDKDVFQLDANDVPETWFNPDTRKIEPIYLHHKGDPIFELDGTPRYKHRIGDIIMENGQPVYKEGLRGLARQFDIVVMDGLYYLTTHDATLVYVKSVLDTIDEWVFDILRDKVTPELLERTSVLYHPKSTVGLIEVYVENGIKTLVKSDQALFIRLFVGDSVYTNTDLRRSMEYSAKKVAQDILESRSTISATDISKAISDNLGSNILGIELRGFMGDEYNTITVIDALTTPSIGKRLSVNSKLELVVEDNVEIEFVWHSKREN